jgi:hypothetical protein
VREGLKKINGHRIKVYAEVGRFGSKKNWHGFSEMTVCLTDLKDEQGNELCDHLWLVCRKQILNLNLGEGDRVSFQARVKSYIKGYRGNRDDVFDKPIERDYKLSNPTQFLKLNTSPKTPELSLGFD